MEKNRDSQLARAFAEQCADARTKLETHMNSRGLRFEDGWRIHEKTRHADGRTIIVMKPIHARLPAPEDLECECWIDEPGEDISSDCQPPTE